mgnify:CR=1 FL=1
MKGSPHLHAAQGIRSSRWARLVVAGGILVLAVLVSATGYRFLGEGAWTWSDCFYMSAITLSTVGFGETLEGMDAHPLARGWTLAVIFMGSGTLLYFVSMLTALIVEGDLGGYLRWKRMRSKIESLNDHVIVCGATRTGDHVLRELIGAGRRAVLVDKDESVLLRLAEEHGDKLLFVVGDSTDDAVLIEAGVERASGVLITLSDDRDALFVTVTARSLNESVRIISSADDPASVHKLERSGAESVVSPHLIGGMRMVSEMIRPTVVHFLDQMLRDREKNLRIEEIAVPANSALDGRTLGQADLARRENALVMAVRDPDGGYVYNPPPGHVIGAGSVLVVLAQSGSIPDLERAIADGTWGED